VAPRGGAQGLKQIYKMMDTIFFTLHPTSGAWAKKKDKRKTTLGKFLEWLSFFLRYTIKYQ